MYKYAVDRMLTISNKCGHTDLLKEIIKAHDFEAQVLPPFHAPTISVAM